MSAEDFRTRKHDRPRDGIGDQRLWQKKGPWFVKDDHSQGWLADGVLTLVDPYFWDLTELTIKVVPYYGTAEFTIPQVGCAWAQMWPSADECKYRRSWHSGK